MLLLCSRRHIRRRFWFPGEVWVVPPVGIVGIAVWGFGWWLVLVIRATVGAEINKIYT